MGTDGQTGDEWSEQNKATHKCVQTAHKNYQVWYAKRTLNISTILQRLYNPSL